MRCPRCRGELVLEDVFTGGRHATVAACVDCRGQWMRDSDLQRLSEVVEPVAVEHVRLAPHEQQSAVLLCPECEDGRPMRKVQSDRDARVVFDHCERCGGVWLDANELSAIQREPLLRVLAGLVRSRPREAPP